MYTKKFYNSIIYPLYIFYESKKLVNDKNAVDDNKLEDEKVTKVSTSFRQGRPSKSYSPTVVVLVIVSGMLDNET